MNKPYKCIDPETGEERVLYDGRYCCVCAIVLAKGEGNSLYVLANKRGPGCPTNVGKWNMPCGYLDDGSGEENASRETYEETGIKISPDNFVLIGLNDMAKERNVTLRYAVVLQEKPELPPLETLKGLGGEENEVTETKWININFIDKYKWAFKHDKVLMNALFEILSYQKSIQNEAKRN